MRSVSGSVYGQLAGTGLALMMLAAPVSRAIADDSGAPPAGPVTWYGDVLPVLQQSCQACHRPAGNTSSGMVAPMSFMTYEEARPWARAIVREVAARRMPPWYAAPEFDGLFELQRTLTEGQIAMIEKWAATGAARGNPEDAPPPIEFPSEEGWTLGTPDLVLPIPEPYWVADGIEDEQPTFEHILTEDELPEDRWIHWIEFRPGNASIVHHGGARVEPLGPDGKPADDPVCGGKIIGTAPGDGPDLWPVGYGKLVRKGSKIIFGMHYHKEPGPGTGAWDQSVIAIKWHTEPVKYVVRAAGIASRGWEIPPGQKHWMVGAAQTFDEDVYIINMMPHMHMRGREAKYEAVYPDGRREVLLHVPDYNYNWQLTYTYKDPKLLPAGTRLESTFWFDNSEENELIPDPGRAVGWGGMTIDEMNIAWTEYANATPIDDWRSHDFGDRSAGVRDLGTFD